MNILAALLLIGASGSATRSLESEQSIAGIVAGVVYGGVKDGLQLRKVHGIAEVFTCPTLNSRPMLSIDSQPRTGWRAWGEAAIRVTYYAVAADNRRKGSVQYSYVINLRKYCIQRRTTISDGCVTLTTDIQWTEQVDIGRLTREIPIYVRVVINANERSGGTVIVGTGTGTADTSDFQCFIVRRIAERQAAATLDRELPRVLRAIEQRGRSWYAAGEMPSIVSSIGDGIRAIGRLRR